MGDRQGPLLRACLAQRDIALGYSGVTDYLFVDREGWTALASSSPRMQRTFGTETTRPHPNIIPEKACFGSSAKYQTEEADGLRYFVSHSAWGRQRRWKRNI